MNLRESIVTKFALLIEAFFVFFVSLSPIAFANPSDPTVVRVGTRLENYPYEYLEKNGEPAGFSVDLFKAIAREMNLSYSFTVGRIWELRQLVQENQLNVITALGTVSGHDNALDFGIPYAEDSTVFFARKGVTPPESLEKAIGLSLMVRRSGALESELIAKQYPTAFVRIDNLQEGFNLLDKDMYDILLASKLIGSLTLNELNMKTVTAGPPLREFNRKMAFAVKKGNGALLEKLNQGLMIVKSSGEYQRIYDKWMTPYLPWWQNSRHLQTALFFALGLMVLWISWIITLRNAVSKRSRELSVQNKTLALEIEARNNAQIELIRHKEDLEGIVLERTFELSRSEARFRGYFEQATVGICIISTEKKYLQINDRACEIHGYTREELLKMNWTDTCFSSNLPTEMSFFNRILTLEIESYVLDKQIARKNGSLLWVSSELRAVFKNDGSIDYLLVLVQDISERKATEEQLLDAIKNATEANAAKSQFLANMSHELRTPMNGIFAMADLLATTTLSTDQRKYLGYVISSSERLLAIINDILDLARIESQKVELMPVKFSLHKLLKEKQEVYGAVAQKKKLEFEVHVPNDLPEIVVGDQMRIDQVICNLLNNAIKFTETGKVILSTAVTSRTKNKLGLRISVIDTGIGISADKIDKLFTYFGQLDMSLTKKYGGTGLGLAISRALAEKMEGGCFVESVPGQGSTFHFDLAVEIPPADHQKSNQSTHKETFDFVLPSISILVIEDDLGCRQVMQELCTFFSLRLTLASSAQEALQLLAVNKFDLIFMDIQLPDTGGVELTKKIRRELGLSTPVIAASAYTHFSKTDLAAAGIQEYLTKPYSIQSFVNTIQAVIRKTEK